jgi:hypothetical protein
LKRISEKLLPSMCNSKDLEKKKKKKEEERKPRLIMFM